MSEQVQTLERSTISPEYISDVPEYLRLETLDKLIDLKKEIEEEFSKHDTDTDYKTFINETIKSMLAEYGIEDDENDPKKHDEYLFAKGVYGEVLKTRDRTDWLTSDNGQDARRRNVIREAVIDWYEEHPSAYSDTKTGDLEENEKESAESTTPPPADDTETYVSESTEPTTKADKDSSSHTSGSASDTPAAREAHDSVKHMPLGENHAEEIARVTAYRDSMRTEYAALLAKRSKKMGLFERSDSVEAMEQQREEYADVVRAVATEMMDKLETNGLSHEQIVAEIDAFIAEQMDEFIATVEEKRSAKIRNKFLRKGLEAWASWGPRDGANFKERIFSSGNVKKGLVYAVPGAAIGAAAAPLIGLVGGGALIVGGATVLSRSIARNLMATRLDNETNDETIAKSQADDIRNEAARLQADEGRVLRDNKGKETRVYSDVTKEILSFAEERSDEHRRRNRRRLVGGVAISLVAGTVAGSIVREFAPDAVGTFGKVGDWFKDRFDSNNAAGNSIVDGNGGNSYPSPHDVQPGQNFESSNNGPGTPNGTPNTLSKNGMFDGRFGTRHLTGEGHKALLNELDGYRVKSGDSVWTISEQLLKAKGIDNPSVFEIDATKDVLLKDLRAEGFADKNGWLTIGDKLTLK